MDNKLYIQPTTKIYTSFRDAKDDFEKYGDTLLFDDKEIIGIEDLAQGGRNLIVGEPGVGKTELLKKIKEHHDSLGDETELINLRSNRVVEEISSFLKKNSKKKKIIILDALDEVRSSIFTEVLQKIDFISKNNPDINIYISSRWVFVNKYTSSFSTYNYIKIYPFSNKQVRDYLIENGHTEEEVNILLLKIMQFGHNRLVLQIPRYLCFLLKFIKDNSIDKASLISRNELFEYFIYSKLDIEDKNLNTDSKSVMKRILEKLALTMEIYQTNTITKDELMTFFDDIDSDLKYSILSNVTLEVFYEKTILQESKSGVDSIEFENAEFQEYLAAKEITRLTDPYKATFSLATDTTVNEIIPSWYNTLTFLVDLMPDILEQIVEFSGLKSDKSKVVDEGFLNFLSRINMGVITISLKNELFVSIVKYYIRQRQWISGQLASSMYGLFTSESEGLLKDLVVIAEKKEDPSRFIELGNVSYIISYLLKEEKTLDRMFWREKLISYANDKSKNSGLQRRAFIGLESLKDKSVIDEIEVDLSGGDDFVRQGFISMCVEVDPNHSKTIQYAIETIKKDDFSGRYALYKIKSKESITFYLQSLIDDDQFRKEFTDDFSLFQDKDSVLVNNIESIIDKDIEKLCIKVLIKLFGEHSHRAFGKSSFILNLTKILKEKNPDFIKNLLEKLIDERKNSHALYFSRDIIAQIIEFEEVNTYIDLMIKAGEKVTAMNTLVRIRYSDRVDKEKIYEAGRLKMPSEYSDWEGDQSKQKHSSTEILNKQIINEFKTKLQIPGTDRYWTDVFSYYVENVDVLKGQLLTRDNIKFQKLIKNILSRNPAEYGLTIDSEHEGSKTYTSSEVAHIFSSVLEASKYLGMDIQPYRKNIALNIPFSHDSELIKIFELIKDFTKSELDPVIDIYRTRHSDLWRHKPESLIELVRKYNLIEAVDIVRDFVKEDIFQPYLRVEALEVVDFLVPDELFLKEIFSIYKDKEDDIALKANALLVVSHGNTEAIKWRLNEIKKRVFTFKENSSRKAHNVENRENELRWDKKFAKPLFELKIRGFENDYLSLLEDSINVWSRGEEFHAYAQYMWEIVYSYFENLKYYKDYGPLKLIERKIDSIKEKNGVNWLSLKIVDLRRAYLVEIGKPKNFAEAIKKYNEVRKYNDGDIRNSTELFHLLKNIIEVDLRNWVEFEGAYNIIVSKKKYAKENKEYEKLVQMTIKLAISGICKDKGLNINLVREEELLSGKKTDFIVRYGFVGPIVLEIKLGSHCDVNRRKGHKETESYKSMETYMKGYGAPYGIFLIMDDIGEEKTKTAKKEFGSIENVEVMELDCHTPANKSRKKT